MRLRYVPLAELRRIRSLEADPRERATLFADACRLNTLYMIARAGSGHIGTSFSCLDILAWLHLEVLGEEDLYFSSKGHDAPALYAVLAGTERIEFGLIHSLRHLNGLAGHPDVLTLPEVHTNTGSLGMGISKAKGFVRAGRLLGRRTRVHVLTGDGELQEGQFWESLQGAANAGMREITAIVDHNKLQSDTWVSQVSHLGDLETKARSFGWTVARCDGNDVAAVAKALDALGTEAAPLPRLLVADTLKGAGVSFMEPRDMAAGDRYAFHSGAPSSDDYDLAVSELRGRIDQRLAELGQERLNLEAVDARPQSASRRPERLIHAYSKALADLGASEERVMVLDADLVLDCGLIPFAERFPERFLECGIAEQDMVSQAGTLALSGLLPIVHSFACFLSARSNEQIYNNATEGTKVIYVGSLAGLVPGGPGHSHQSVRDISALGAMPGMTLPIEPSSEHETRLALEWAVRDASGPVYLRLVSAPWSLGFEPRRVERLVPGRGEVLREGDQALLVGAGPVMISQGWAAAERLSLRGIECGVVALPWLRDVDGAWLSEAASGTTVFCLDNHFTTGGQGDAVLAALAAANHREPVVKLAVEQVPVCGTNDEVLRAHGLDAERIASRVSEHLLASP